MSKGTPTTPFRIPPDLKARVKRAAKARGETLTDIVIRAFEQYPPSAEDASPAGNTPQPPTK